MRIGLDLGGTKIEGVVLAANGEILERIRQPSPSNSYPGIVTALTRLVSELERAVGAHAIGLPAASGKFA